MAAAFMSCLGRKPAVIWRARELDALKFFADKVIWEHSPRRNLSIILGCESHSEFFNTISWNPVLPVWCVCRTQRTRKFSRTATSAPLAPIRLQIRQISVTTRTQLVEHVQKCRRKCANSGVVWPRKLRRISVGVTKQNDHKKTASYS